MPILLGSKVASLLREFAFPNTEWQTAGKTDDGAPLFGGTWDQFYPRPKGVKKLAALRKKATLVGAPAHVTDSANADAPYGTTSLRFNGTASYEFRSTLAGTNGVVPAVDITKGTVSFKLRAGPNLFTNRGTMKLRLYSSGSPSAIPADYTDLDFGFMNGLIAVRNAVDWGPWQQISIPGYNASLPADGLAGITKTGAGATATAITWASIVMSGNSTGVQFEIGDIDFIPNPRTKGAVIFTFDDSRPDSFTNAAEIMSRYGFPGVLFPGAPATEIGGGRLTVQQLKLLQDFHGWQIGSGCWTSENIADFNALTSSGKTAYFAKLRAFHASLGLRGGMDFAYQSSFGMADQLDLFNYIRQHFRTGRLYGGPSPTGQPILHFGECAPLGDPLRYRSVDFSGPRFQVANAYANDIKSFVDQAANNKAAAIFVVHNNFQDTDLQNLQNLRDMCADVYSRNDVEWITMDEYVRSYS